MRIAVVADIHGSVIALDAVLLDAASQEVTHYWVLGDLVAYGPRPVEVLRRLQGLPQLRCVRGNTDRYVLTGDLRRMIPAIDNPKTAREHRVLADARESFAWTRGCLVGSDQYGWLQALPLEERATLPDGTRVLMVHASPGRDDGWGMHPDRSDDELAEMGFNRSGADLVLVGHTHVPGERQVGDTRVVNPGPVNLPRAPDDGARWALITATANGYAVELRRVSYHVPEVIADLHRQHHPASDWLEAKLSVPSAVG